MHELCSSVDDTLINMQPPAVANVCNDQSIIADIQCLGNTDAIAEQNSNHIELPSPELEIHDPQTHKYSEVVQMTSTPRIQNHNKPQKLLPIQRKTVRAQSQVPENQSLNDNKSKKTKPQCNQEWYLRC